MFAAPVAPETSPVDLNALRAKIGQLTLGNAFLDSSLIRVGLLCDATDGGSDDESKGLFASTSEKIAQATCGVTYAWTLLLSIAIGIWLTFTRVSFDTSGAIANRDHLIGLLGMTFSIMVLAEMGRAIRFLNIPFRIWLVAAPWLLGGADFPLAAWNGVIGGVLMIVLAILRRAVKNSYARWNRHIV